MNLGKIMLTEFISNRDKQIIIYFVFICAYSLLFETYNLFWFYYYLSDLPRYLRIKNTITCQKFKTFELLNLSNKSDFISKLRAYPKIHRPVMNMLRNLV